ncbi:MAG: hypothetical protein P8P30_10865 [Rickettsiales bacterium]|nr:hypothetical protein [Rickettsiales bacterium]
MSDVGSFTLNDGTQANALVMECVMKILKGFEDRGEYNLLTALNLLANEPYKDTEPNVEKEILNSENMTALAKTGLLSVATYILQNENEGDLNTTSDRKGNSYSIHSSAKEIIKNAITFNGNAFMTELHSPSLEYDIVVVNNAQSWAQRS